MKQPMVDEHYRGAGHVYQDEEGNNWSVMLNQASIAHNNNKYYVIQLIEDAGKYCLFTRWGRVGEPGQNSTASAASLAAAQKAFSTKFNDKTKNVWDEIRADPSKFKKFPGKYLLIETSAEDDGGAAPAVVQTAPAVVQNPKSEKAITRASTLHAKKPVIDMVIRDGEAQRIEDVKALVLEVAAPELSPGADAASVEVSSLTGGITNQLFRAKFPSGRSVVVRVYGLGTERIISRAAEVYWQSQFLRTFGRCRNGLVYEFLDGMHPVADAAECAQVAPRIAAALARFHHDATRNSLMTPPYATEALYLDVVCSDWLATAREALVKLVDNPTAAAVVQQWTQRCAQVCEVVGALKPHLPVAVCHNDLLLGNVMVDETGTVRVIDFEYARRNYALYDVANHFNEWPGFDCDWTQLPTPDQRRAFLGAYFAEMQACGVQVDASAAVVEAADVLVDVLMLASHAAWGVWAVYQQAHSAIAFDYLPYSNRRLARYDSTVDAVLARAKATFPECFP